MPGQEITHTTIMPFKEQLSDSNEESRNKSKKPVRKDDLGETLKSLLWTLRVFGMYYLNQDHGTDTLGSKVALIYSVFVNAVLLTHLGRLLIILKSISSIDLLIAQGQFLIYAFYTSFLTLVMLMFCARCKGWREFFSLYKQLQEHNWAPKISRLNRRCNIYVMMSWAGTMINVIFGVYSIFFTSSFDIYAMPVAADHQHAFTWKIISMLGYIYSAGIGLFAFATTIILCDLLGRYFKAFNDDIGICIEQNPKQFGEFFEDLKDMHHRLCGLVGNADGLLSCLMAAHVAAHLSLISILLYLMLYNPLNSPGSISYFAGVFWLMASIVVLFSTSGVGAWLHEHAHGAVSHIQNVKIKHVNQDVYLEMMMFINKLNGSPIGVTVGKMFVVDKNSILTYIGVIISYFFILLSFRPSSLPPECDCAPCNVNLTSQMAPPV